MEAICPVDLPLSIKFASEIQAVVTAVERYKVDNVHMPIDLAKLALADAVLRAVGIAE